MINADSIICDVEKRHDFVFEINVERSNPNGDPLMDNQPRHDNNGYGEITDGCIKRRIRNVAEMMGQNIFIRQGAYLNELIEEAHNTVKEKTIENKQQFMLDKYWDIRMFGAVLSTGKNAGKVQGPVSLVHAVSKEPIQIKEYSITRCAGVDRTTTKKDKNGDEVTSDKLSQSMGRYYLVDKAVYESFGSFNPFLAKKTNVSREDLAVFWSSLIQIFQLDESKNRSSVYLSKLTIFTHEQTLGSVPRHLLLNGTVTDDPRITITKCLE